MEDPESFQVLMVLSRSPYICLPSGLQNVQTILHISPSILQHHWFNSLTSCCYLATYFVHILHFSLVHKVLYIPPQKEIYRYQIWWPRKPCVRTPHLLIHWNVTCWLRKVVTGLAEHGGVPSCQRCIFMLSVWLHDLSARSGMMLLLLGLPQKWMIQLKNKMSWHTAHSIWEHHIHVPGLHVDFHFTNSPAVSVHLTGDVECCFVREDNMFQKCIIIGSELHNIMYGRPLNKQFTNCMANRFVGTAMNFSWIISNWSESNIW
jgi:hypothetical protein